MDFSKIKNLVGKEIVYLGDKCNVTKSELKKIESRYDTLFSDHFSSYYFFDLDWVFDLVGNNKPSVTITLDKNDENWNNYLLREEFSSPSPVTFYNKNHCAVYLCIQCKEYQSDFCHIHNKNLGVIEKQMYLYQSKIQKERLDKEGTEYLKTVCSDPYFDIPDSFTVSFRNENEKNIKVEFKLNNIISKTV